MSVTCVLCGATVADESAIAVPSDGGVARYCSTACADRARANSADARRTPLALPAAPRRILVAVDGSGPALRAVEYAVMLAKLCGASVRLLSAIEPMGLRGLGEALPAGRLAEVVREIEATLRQDAEAQLQRPREICAAAGVSWSADVVFKLPLEAILEAANDADLIVMGSRGRGAVTGALFGSVSQRVLGGTRTSVLIVH